MLLKNTHVLLLGLLLMVSSCRQEKVEEVTMAVPPVWSLTPYLLPVEEVAKLLKSPNPPLLIEVSKKEHFSQGHLPGAVNLWRPDYEDTINYPYGGMKATRQDMGKLMGNLGAKNDELVLVYCTKGSVDAARIQWILQGYGHQNVAMIDGGKAAWKHAGYPLEDDTIPQRTPTDYQFQLPENTAQFVSLQEIKGAINDTNTIILDTREDYEFWGMPHVTDNGVVHFKKGAFAAGAIPGAIHLNWSEAVDLKKDHTFKSLESIKHNFLRQGVTPDKKIIAYCQSGVRSAHTAFVLKHLLGYPDVKSYDGSWIEWSYNSTIDTSVHLQQHTPAEEVVRMYQTLAASLDASSME